MAVALAAGTGACASVAENRAGNAFVADTPSTVVVSNDNWHDMRVYAVRNGSRLRLGTVTSMSRETFKLPESMLGGAGELQLQADPIGASQGYRSPPLLVRSGQQVEFILRNNLALSTTSVW